MATLTSVKAIAVSSESCVVSSVRTNFLPCTKALAVKFCYLQESKKSSKVLYQLSILQWPSVIFNLFALCAYAHSVPRVQFSSSFVRSCMVILVRHNAYHIHTLFSGIINARLRIYFLQTMPLPCNSPYYIYCFYPWRSFINHHRLQFPLISSSETLLLNVWNSIT